MIRDEFLLSFQPSLMASLAFTLLAFFDGQKHFLYFLKIFQLLRLIYFFHLNCADSFCLIS